MPFVYLDRDARPTGIAVQVATELLKRSGLQTSPLSLYPLPRMLDVIAKNPDTLGIAIFRSVEREKKYRWIVPVTPLVTSVLVKLNSRSDIKISNKEDAKKYLIGVVNENNLHIQLVNDGFKNIAPVATNEQNYKKLFGKRIDLFAGREASIYSEMVNLGYSVKDISIVYKFDKVESAWLVGHPKLSIEIIKKIQSSYEKLKKDKFIEKVTLEYFTSFKK